MGIILADILLWGSGLFILGAVFIITYFSFISKRFKGMYRHNDRSILTEYSSFISSLTGPLFAIGGSLIIYSTIINQNQKENISHFETVFFKLLDYHRDNNNEIFTAHDPFRGNELKGKRVFTNFYNQLYVTTSLLKAKHNYLSQSELLNISFVVFYTGIASKSDSNDVVALLSRTYRNRNDIDLSGIISDLDEYSDSIRKKNKTKRHFYDGNKTRLSHYFKQFFDVLSYIHNQEHLSKEEKLYYSTILSNQNGLYEKIIFNSYINSSISPEDHKLLWKSLNIDKQVLNRFNSLIDIDKESPHK